MRLSRLIVALKKVEIVCDGDWEREILSLSCDSKTVEKSSLFFCLTGKGGDGHAYASEAVARGAVVIVTERKLDINAVQLIVENTRESMSLLSCAFYDYPSKDMKIIGITGTNGKTTTSYMLTEILKKAGKRVGVIGTLGIVYENNRLPNDMTTPDPIYLQRTLAQMRDFGIEYVCMEVSAHALYYQKIAGIVFTACIFTNLTQDHLDFFADMHEYAQAKAKLFNPSICPIAILNGDDEYTKEITKIRMNAKTILYGINNNNNVFAERINETLHQTRFYLNMEEEVRKITLQMIGKHNVYNALSATACAYVLGIAPRTIAYALCEMKGVNGRLERIENYNGAEIFVDFAHTPDGLEKTLLTLRPHCKGRLICVFGCGGNRDKSKRSIMGKTVASNADFAVLTSDNPRFEDPLDILSQIENGYREVSRKYVIVPRREDAIAYAMDIAKNGDIVLIAGKGGEEYQEIMGIKYPFKDNDIIKKQIQKKP